MSFLASIVRIGLKRPREMETHFSQQCLWDFSLNVSLHYSRIWPNFELISCSMHAIITSIKRVTSKAVNKTRKKAFFSLYSYGSHLLPWKPEFAMFNIYQFTVWLCKFIGYVPLISFCFWVSCWCFSNSDCIVPNNPSCPLSSAMASSSIAT